MLWFGGNITEAVTLSKQRNAIFVVFIEGDNDLSREMSAVLGDSAVTKTLSDETNFLVIKLKSGSENYTHFAQIYQFVPVPSLFFIGRNGTPLEVVCAGVAAPNLAQRIDRILEEHRKGKQPAAEPLMQSTVQPSTSSQNIREQTVDLLQAEGASQSAPLKKSSPVSQRADTPSEPAAKIQKTEHNEPAKPDQEYEVVCDGDVCVRRPKVPVGEEAGPSKSDVSPATPLPAAEESTADMEQKLERAKELIEAKRREKAEKEKELEKQKELERRSLGQGVAELRKWQADQELKQIQEERKREKLENNLARQRILEQIAQDRAERRARDLPPAQNAQNVHSAQSDQSAQNAQEIATSGDGSARARVQFKMPDGTSHTAHFDADDTLSELHRYIAQYMQMSPSSFSFWTAFPRQELTENEATLRRLQLAPSAALLVLPRRQPAHVATPSAFSSLIAFITQLFSSLVLEPSQQVYAWLRARLFRSPPSVPPAEPTPPPRSPSGGVRRRGNIHRLTGESPADDDNNTWNGNSTQQM